MSQYSLAEAIHEENKHRTKEEAEREVEQGMKVFPLSVCVKPASDMLFVKHFSPFQKPPARL